MKKSAVSQSSLVQIAPRSKQNFERVRSVREKVAIFKELIESKLPVHLKNAKDDILTFFPAGYHADMGLVGQMAETEHGLQQGESIICNFSLKQDRYFFQSEASPMRALMSLKAETLYILQRRSHTRYDIDANLNNSVIVVQKGSQVVYLKGKAEDISMGGVKLVLFPDSERVASGDILRVSVHIGERWHFEGVGTVRYYKQAADRSQHFGFQFDEASKRMLQGKLQMMIVDLQRRSFKAYAKP